jgi:hypothetical protein
VQSEGLPHGAQRGGGGRQASAADMHEP